MTARIAVKGSKELQAAIRNASKEAKRQVGVAIEASALEIRGDIVQRIQRGPASGRVYQKYNPRRTHQASAPGEAPMSDTGRLANSVVYDREGPLRASVSTIALYGPMLEFGTRKMAPRPAWRPAIEDAQSKLLRRIEAALKEAYT